MKKIKSIIAFKVTIFCLLFCLLSAVAMPKYLDLNKQNAANQCKINQILVETALAVAFGENLEKGIVCFPDKLSEDMFADGKIPVCPIDGTPIQFDPETGKAFCPHHHESHER